MAGITLMGSKKTDVTVVSNAFIDAYMAEANGEFVKIYLYLLRNLGNVNQRITISSMADIFNHTEKDIVRSLIYWEKAGLLYLNISEKKEIVGIEVLDLSIMEDRMDSKQESAATVQPAVKNLKEDRRNRNPHSIEHLEKLKGNDEFGQLMYIAQQYIGSAFKPVDCDVFAYLYNELEFSVELLEYLIEYCVSNGQKSVRYMESVALDWHGRGIMTIDRAKSYTTSYSKDYFMVMKAFGISDRRPATIEKNIMDKWFHDYGFTSEVILAACDRTISKIHQPSFEYADKILSGWRAGEVKSLSDIERLDMEYKSGEKKRNEKPHKSPAKQTSRFHNFEQRSVDYEALLKKMKQN